MRLAVLVLMFIAFIVAMAVLPGCQSADAAAKAINGYCAATTETERMVIRARVAELIAPNTIAIHCAQPVAPVPESGG